MTNILVNPGFEKLWGGSRRCVMIDNNGRVHIVDIGNIQCPQGWAVWFVNERDVWHQPEGRMSSAVNPFRMRTGMNGYQLFKSFGRHQSGLMQVIDAEKGAQVKVRGFAHAWSNHYDPDLPDEFPHPSDRYWSEGAGYDAYFALEGEVSDDDVMNFTFSVGIDPVGGIDPFAETVVWGQGAHIYNSFREVPGVEAVAESDSVTVFLRHKCIWPFKHTDAYWDDIEAVVVIADEPVCRGAPREQYDRVYYCFPQDAEWSDYAEVVEDLFNARRTIGFSWDDAGIGDLDERVAAMVDVDDEEVAESWFDVFYPGVETQMIEIKDEPEPPGPEPQPKPNCVISLHRQTDESGIQNYLEKVQPEWIKVVNGMEDARKYKAWGAKNVDVRIPVANSKQFIDSGNVEGYLANFDDALEANIDYVDAIEDLNEENPADPKVIAFCIATSNEIVRRYGDAVKLCSLNLPVGNGDGIQLLDLARVLADNKHLLGYHCYHPVCMQWAEEWMESEAQWYHLRNLYHIDPFFTANGVYVDWLGTESGAVEGIPLEGDTGMVTSLWYGPPRVARLNDEFMIAKAIEKQLEGMMQEQYEAFGTALNVGPLDPTGGWRSPDALNGDLDRYIKLQLRLKEKIGVWNTQNGNRMRGTTIFTVGASFVGWSNFKLWESDMDAFAEALA